MANKPNVQENIILNFAKRLASNDKTARDRAVRKLKKWINLKSVTKKGLTDEDLLKLWKGLHYCFWMSDKPLIQEELSGVLSQLVHVLQKPDVVVRFLDAFLVTQAREWSGIDNLRLDKFLMLVRCFFKETLKYLQKHSWDEQLVSRVLDVYSKTVLDLNSEAVPNGLKLHMIDMYYEELANIGHEELDSEQVMTFLKPYCQQTGQIKSATLLRRLLKRVFREILEHAELQQLASQALADEGAFDMEVGSDEEGVDDDDNDDDENEDEEEEEDGEDDDSGQEMDTADAEDDDIEEEENEEDEEDDTEDLPPMLEVDLSQVADALFAVASSKQCLKRNRKLLYNMVTKLRDAAEGTFHHDDVSDVSDDEEEFERLVNKTSSQLTREEIKTINTDKETKAQRRREKRERLKAERKQQGTSEQDSSQSSIMAEKKSKNKFKNKGRKKKNIEESDDGDDYDSDDAMEMAEIDEEESENASLNEDEKLDSLNKTNKLDSERTSKKKKKKPKQKNMDSSIDSNTDSKKPVQNGVHNDTTDSHPVQTAKSPKQKKNKNVEPDFDTVSFDDVETNAEVTPKSKKKKDKKSKNKESPVQKSKATSELNSSQNSNKGVSNTNSSPVAPVCNLQKILSSDKSTLSDKQQTTPTKNKKQKKRAADDAFSESPTIESVVESPPQKKKKRKSTSSDEATEESTPGKTQELITNKISGKENKASKKQRRQSAPEAGSTFAKFEAGATPPPAFVKKAMLKANKPKAQSAQKAKKQKSDEDAKDKESKRRVSFGLHKNCAQSTKEYAKTLKSTPDVPFNPEVKPDTSILKATPVSSKKNKKLNIKRRSNAADFF